MSDLARWVYTNVATVWPIMGHDEWSRPVFGEPYLINCTWRAGGDIQRDADGNQFVPVYTFWFEAPYTAREYEPFETTDGVFVTSEDQQYQVLGDMAAATVPKREDRIIRFNRLADTSPPHDAMTIKRVVSHDYSFFGDSQLPDWEINT